MYKTNAKYGGSHNFYDISSYTDKKGKTKWIAWFYRDIKNIGDIE